MAETKASKDPERIEAEIEQTREDLGETVAALAEKTDVKKQAHDKVEAASQTANRTLEALRENPAPAVATLGALVVVALIVRRRRR